MIRVLVLIGLLIACAVTWGQGIALPETPAGEQLKGYLTAFNSGRRETLRDFLKANMEGPPNAPTFADDVAGQQMGTFRMTGAFDVRQVGMSEPHRIHATVQGRATGIWMVIMVYVAEKAPFQIVGMGFRNTAPPAELLPRKALSEGEIRARVGGLMKKMAANDGFSGVVYVAKGRRPVYSQAFGMASKAWNAPNRIDTKFNLASITKMFTAVAVAQLVEQGKLAYTDTVGKILPDYPNTEVASKVTIHHLLSHTSGMIDARRLADRPGDGRSHRTLDDMVKPFAVDPLDFTPGERFSYSNAAFILLGKIVEKASGQRYFDYVKSCIFLPARMTNTDFYLLDQETPNLATGYVDGPGGKRYSNIFDLGVIGSPAGGAYSTVEDLQKFHLALVDGTLLKKGTQESLWRRITENSPNAGYGYGAQVSQYNGHRMIGHGGGWKGITNQFEMYPELGYTVVVLSNYDVEPGTITDLLRGWLTQGTSPTWPEK